MDFNELMAKARANEKNVKKSNVRRPVNLEPARATQKIRADLVRRHDEDKKRRAALEERTARQELEKLARMEAAMAEHERKVIEEQEKQEKLQQMHKEAQERKAKMEAEIQAKKDVARQEIERKRTEERDKKRRSRDGEDNIFRRREQELEAKEKRREEKRNRNDIWKRRQAEKQRIKMKEEARRIASSFGKKNHGSGKRLLDIEESARLRKQELKRKEMLKRKKKMRIKRASQIELRGEQSSSDNENAPQTPAPKTKDTRGTDQITKMLGGADISTVTKALQQFIKYPVKETKDVSDAEYDSHEEQNPNKKTLTTPKITSGSIQDHIRSSATLNSLSYRSIDSPILSPDHGIGKNVQSLHPLTYTPGPSCYPSLNYSPHPNNLASASFTNSILSELNQDVHLSPPIEQFDYSPAPLSSQQFKYSPSPVTSVSSQQVEYSPTPVTSTCQQVEYSPAPISSQQIEYSPTPVSSQQVEYSPAPVTSTYQQVEYSPAPILSQQVEYSPASVTSTCQQVEYSPAPISSEQVEYSPTPVSSQQFEYSPAPISVSSQQVEYSPGPVAISSEKIEYSPGPISSQQVEYLPTTVAVSSPPVPVSSKFMSSSLKAVNYESVEGVAYTTATIDSETLTSPSRNTETRPPSFDFFDKSNETEIDCENTPVQELPSNECEINCSLSPIPSPTYNLDYSGSSGNESEDYEEKSNPRKRSLPRSASSDENILDEKSQGRLQELFGNTDNSEIDSEESDEEKEVKKTVRENEEEEKELSKSQNRRNKLKELARRKRSSSDSLSDYDHKDRGIVEEEEPVKKPDNFQELMALADKKNEQNRKELEIRKHKEEKSAQLKKEKEEKRKLMLMEIERKKQKQEREEERRLHQKQKERQEKLKKRIPKRPPLQGPQESAKASNPRDSAKSANKPKTVGHHKNDRDSVVRKSLEHPNKRKKLTAPGRTAAQADSFEELMKMANENSKKSTFGSSIKRPEDFVREQKRKEAEKKRELNQYLNFRPTCPLPSSSESRHKQRERREISHERDKIRNKERSNEQSDRNQAKRHPDDRPSPRDRAEETRRDYKNEEFKRKERPGYRPDRRSAELGARKHPKEEKRKQVKKKPHVNPYMDDDLEDFVVSDGEEVDVSKAIRNMFGYDKRKFRDEDDDCRDMVTDFRTIQREEARSAKIAKKEDAEELKRIMADEEREQKRKKVKK